MDHKPTGADKPARAVIVTGASRGLGAAAAQILAEMGAGVVLVARAADDLEHVAGAIRAAGGRAEIAAGDITRPETSAQAVDTALAAFGGLDAIVNNAGVLEPVARIAHADGAAWRHNLDVNVIGPVLLTQAALPALRERGGRVVNVSSGAAVKAIAGWGAYCVSKAALNHFTVVLAHEEPAITAVALRPGTVDTTMQSVIRREGGDVMDADAHARFVRLHQEDALNPPELPGRALAALALYAPNAWSGELIQWQEDRVQALLNDAPAG